ATTGKDALVRIWDVASTSEKRQLQGHTGCTRSVTFSSDGRLIASTGCDRVVRLWDAKTGEQVRELGGLTDAGSGVAFSPDGKLIAAGSYDKTVRVWDTATGGAVKAIEGHKDLVTAVAFGPKGRVLYSAGADKTIRMWNLAAAESREERGGHQARALGVAFSPDGKLLASVGTDKSVRLWNAKSGELLQVMLGHRAIVGCVAFDPTGELLATGSIDGSVRLWDVGTGNELDVLGKHETGIYKVAFSPDGNTLASACNDGTVRLWDVGTGTQRLKLEGHSLQVCAVDFSPDGKYLASGSRDKTIRIWEAFTGEPIETLTGHELETCPLSFNPQGTHLASTSGDETVRLWEVGTWDSKLAGRHKGNPFALLFLGQEIHVGVSRVKSPLKLWSSVRSEEVALGVGEPEMQHATFSPDGTRIATSTDQGNVVLWDTATGRPVWRAPMLKRDPPAVLTHEGWVGLAPTSSGALMPASKWRTAVESRVRTASQSHDGKLLCVATFDGELELWSIEGDERLFADRVDGLEQVVALPDGCLVGTTAGQVRLYKTAGSHQALYDRAGSIAYEAGRQEIMVTSDDEVKIFDRAGKAIASHQVDLGVTAMTRVDGLLVLGFNDGAIQLADLNNSSAQAEIRSGEFSFEGVPASSVERFLEGPKNTLVAGYANGFLGIWSMRSGTLLHHFKLHGPIEHLLFDDETLYAVTALGDRQTLDLGVLGRNYCDLMNEVWDAVPVLWSEGRAVANDPPTDHECSAN
ncbi:MAG: WD40 repeat domain-containing protein, partial [Deltaproteobacteria bacterium]|nr:WD40 repeat domain-containing protein [Deltaproteobacteria bacterium]